MRRVFTKETVKRDIASRLKNSFKVEVYDEMTSTFSLAEQMPLYSVVIALKQSSGRGRLDRQFYCQKGGIYMSICLPASDPPTLATPAAGVAVCRAIKHVMGLECGIKWVNDVKYRGKKVSGILTEYLISGGVKRTVTGIGINYCVALPESLQGIAATLTDNFVYDDFVGLAAAVTDEFCDIMRDGNFIDEYRALCLTVGQEVIFDGKTYLACGINDNGELIAEANGKRVVINTGEISER